MTWICNNWCPALISGFLVQWHDKYKVRLTSRPKIRRHYKSSTQNCSMLRQSHLSLKPQVVKWAQPLPQPSLSRASSLEAPSDLRHLGSLVTTMMEQGRRTWVTTEKYEFSNTRMLSVRPLRHAASLESRVHAVRAVSTSPDPMKVLPKYATKMFPEV